MDCRLVRAVIRIYYLDAITCLHMGRMKVMLVKDMPENVSRRFLTQLIRWMIYNFIRIEGKLSRYSFRFLRYVFAEKHIRPILHKKKFSLDIGCGNTVEGDVSIDLFIVKSEHRIDINIEYSLFDNFIIADAQDLPFRNSVFQVVRCSHVLEHLKEPLKGIKEMSRVSKEMAIILVPTPMARDRTTTHLYTWSPWTLSNLIKLGFRDAKTIVTYGEIIGIGIK